MSYEIHMPGWVKGVDNIHADFELPRDSLRAAVNTDIYDSGKLRRRRGVTSRAALVGAHSLWSDPWNPNPTTAYYSVSGNIYSLNSGLTATSVVTGLSPIAKVTFAHVDGEVFWSNGAVKGRITGGANTPWGLETPSGQPDLTATSGSLLAGTYQVAMTYKNAAGEESATQNSVGITLAATGGIALTNIPVPVNAAITRKSVYLTSQNGDVLYLAVTLAANVTSYTFTTPPAQSIVLRTQDLAPIPAGTIIAHRNGVMYVASGKYVYYSEPLRYGLYNPVKNFYAYSEDVSVMLATPDGLYVCADKTYFISNPATVEATQTMLFPFGAASGTGAYLPNKADVTWMSERGQVVASGGTAEILTEKTFMPAIIGAGVSFVREQEGIRQIISVAQQSELNTLNYTGA